MNIKLICPKCKSTAMVKDGKTKIGTQRYKCKLCGTRSSGEKSFKKAKLNGLYCKYCNSENIRKKGFTKANNQMYYCNDCGKKFVLKPLETFTTQEKNFILKYYFCLNISAVEIAKHLGKTKDQVYYFLRKYKEKRK